MTRFKEDSMASGIGKVVGGARYVHRSALPLVDPTSLQLFRQALAYLYEGVVWNVVKFRVRNGKSVSFLLYDDFKADPFPVLTTSTQVDLLSGKVCKRSYSRVNPPILHRKELLIAPNNQNSPLFSRLTSDLERLGAFKEIYKFGTKLRWEERLRELNLKIENHTVCLHSNKNPNLHAHGPERHKTALKRKSLSSCMGALLDTSLINQETEIFDYGCGRGDDISILLKNKFTNVSGWDPYFYPENVIPQTSEFVTLSFVINVIENQNERHKTLKKAFTISQKALVFSVMLEHQANLHFAKPLNDGFVTTKNTFQKYYNHEEIVSLVFVLLGERAIKLDNGVYLVFKDKELEQEYLFKRQLGLLVCKRSRKADNNGDRYLAPMVEAMQQQIMTLGRIPKTSELPKALEQKISKSAVSYTRLARLALSQISISDLQKVGEIFSSEVLIFIAINMFEKRLKYNSLPHRLQNDVKVHFGSLKVAEQAAKELLYSMSDTDKLISSALDAEKNALGYIVGRKFRFHGQNLLKIPVNLRFFARIAERLHREINATEIIQLHLDTKKVSYFDVTDFDKSPLPRIASREIVNFSNQEVSHFTHTDKGEVKILYLKSIYMDESDPHFSQQRQFDDLVRLKFSHLFKDGDEPKFETFARQLLTHKIAIPKY